jgi:hypothetical protein
MRSFDKQVSFDETIHSPVDRAGNVDGLESLQSGQQVSFCQRVIDRTFTPRPTSASGVTTPVRVAALHAPWCCLGSRHRTELAADWSA